MSGEGVVLLHGLGNSARIMRPMARALEAADYAVCNLSYASKLCAPSENVAALTGPIMAFAGALNGPVHFVGHSLGGLMIRAYLARHRPKNLGRVVMLGTPNQGSEVADFSQRLWIGWAALGKAAPFLITRRTAGTEAQLGTVHYPLGIIAGDTPLRPALFAPLFKAPYDGKVSIISTKLAGMTDHIVLSVAHDPMPRLTIVQHQVLAFLQHGAFDRMNA